MYTIKPKNPSHLCGVSISTIIPKQRALLFLSPVLSSRGNEARKAWKAYDDYHREAEDGEEKKEKTDEKDKYVTLKLMIESLKQQYYLELPDGEEETEEKWIDAVSEYFTEADLQRIPVSIRFGKEMSLAELMEKTKEIANTLPKQTN